jgi:hypothetical protein
MAGLMTARPLFVSQVAGRSADVFLFDDSLRQLLPFLSLNFLLLKLLLRLKGRIGM